MKLKTLELDLDVDAGGKIELHEGVDGLRGRIDNVEKALVRAHLELLAALLVDMRRTVDGELLDAGRQRNGSANLRAGPFRRVHDLTRRRIENPMVERLEPYANILAVHCRFAFFIEWQTASSEFAFAARYCLFASSLLDDRGNHAGADGAAAFTDGEAQLLFHRDRHDQVHFHVHVVARHHHLGAFRQMHDAGHVGGAEVELRTVVGEERGVTTALLLGENVGFSLELGVRLDRTRLAQHLTALDFLALGAAEERADVVARLALIEQLAEHFDTGDGGLLRRTQTDDLDFLADLDDAALDTAGHHGAAAGDREHVFDRHQEGLIDRTLGLRNVFVDIAHQLEDRIVAELLVGVFKRGQRRALDDRNLVAGELVLRQQLANLELDEFEQFRIVDHVALVEVHDERGHADLAGEQDVLAGLGHRAVGRRHDEDRAVHLGSAGDHVLHIVGVAGAVDVRIVALLGLVLDMSGRNRDAARLLLRRLVDLVVRRERRTAGFSQHLGDRRRQRRLAVVDVTDRSNVAVRFGTFKLCFGHLTLRSIASLRLTIIRQTSSGLLPTRSPALPRSGRTAS